MAPVWPGVAGGGRSSSARVDEATSAGRRPGLRFGPGRRLTLPLEPWSPAAGRAARVRSVTHVAAGHRPWPRNEDTRDEESRRHVRSIGNPDDDVWRGARCALRGGTTAERDCQRHSPKQYARAAWGDGSPDQPARPDHHRDALDTRFRTG